MIFANSITNINGFVFILRKILRLTELSHVIK
jgi:hypothetical protein